MTQSDNKLILNKDVASIVMKDKHFWKLSIFLLNEFSGDNINKIVKLDYDKIKLYAGLSLNTANSRVTDFLNRYSLEMDNRVTIKSDPTRYIRLFKNINVDKKNHCLSLKLSKEARYLVNYGSYIEDKIHDKEFTKGSPLEGREDNFSKLLKSVDELNK